MIQQVKSLPVGYLLWGFSALFILAFCLPAYFMHPLVSSSLEQIENPIARADENTILYGYACALWALVNIFESPIFFLGSLANFSIFSIWLLQFLRIPGKMRILKGALVVICIVSTLIWPVTLHLGLLMGYYCWMAGAIGISIAFSIQKPFKEDFREDLLDDLDVSS